MNIRIVRLLVMMALLFGNSLNIKINQEKLRNIIGENDWFSILQNGEKESPYSIVFPQVLKNRVRRFATFEVEDESSSRRVLLSSPAVNFNFSLDLVPVTTILSPEFLVFETFQNTSNVLPIDHRDIRNCLYRGRTSALSLCDGQMTGIVHHNEKETYLIRPVPKILQNEIGNAHLLIRKPFHEMSNQHLNNNEGECIYGRENADVNCSHITNSMGNRETPFENSSVTREELEKAEHLQPNLKNNVSTHSKACDDDGKECRGEISHHGNLHRKKRKVGQEQGSPIFVETAVFVDKDLYSHMKNYFPNDTERELIRFVLAMVNAVQLLYHDPSLGHAVNFILKRLEILKEEPVNLTRPSDIDRFLSSFCNWQRIKNPGGDREPQHWDHALMLTGLDLYVKSKHGKVSSQVVGLAPVAGMCTPTSSCTVNEGRHFESVYVVAHEIGHNLGMRHDGPLADNDCDPTSYIMSPTLGSGKITWSPCSKRYLQTFLDTSQSKCLLDHGNSAGQLDHEAEGNLPGERFNADQQCRLKYGKDSKHSPQQLLEDICRDLHCDREKYTWTSHPALEGTKCGHNMWCRGGKCISRKLNPLKIAYASSPGALLIEKVDGNWSKWKSKGECDSGCLFGEEGRLRSGSTGIMVSVRKCDNPRPQGGGKSCQGIDRKFQTCVAKQCLNVPRLTINEFANQICARAKEVDKELTGLGFQKNSIDAQESCAVWCSRRNGQVKARGWSFPDGTACNLKLSNNTKGSSYCIDGRCEEFLCNSSKEVQFLKHPEQCPKFKEVDKYQPQKIHRDESKEVTENWMVASSCHYNCILPGTGIRLVFNKHKRKYYTIQLCEPSRQICTKLRSPLQYASMICGQYKDRVQGLSGYGMQIYPNEGEDPDRPCKVACQDDTILHRFYLVNGKGGWFPFGTECSGKNAKRKAYCVSGKCIEFTQEDVPVAEYTQSLFPRLLRKRRSIEHDLLV